VKDSPKVNTKKEIPKDVKGNNEPIIANTNQASTESVPNFKEKSFLQTGSSNPMQR